MLSVVLILLAVALYGVLHSLLASLGAKARARELSGETGARFYRLFFNLVGVITLLPVLALVRILPDAPLYRIPMPWLLLALFIQVLAVVMLAVGVMQTGALKFTGLDAFTGQNRSPRMVTGGLYRWVRHPLYTAGMLFMLATPIMTRNLLALYSGFAAYLVIGAMVEERKLLVEFGEAYAGYRQRTGMFLPKRESRAMNREP